MKKKQSLSGEETGFGDTVNHRLFELRHALNLTQKEFAAKICISGSFLAAMELGVKNVLNRHIKLVVNTFGANENWLKTGEGEMFAKDMVPDYKITETVEIFKALNPFFQDFILDQLRKLQEYENSVTAKNQEDGEKF